MAKPISFTKRDLEKKKQEKRLAKQQKKEERKNNGTPLPVTLPGEKSGSDLPTAVRDEKGSLYKKVPVPNYIHTPARFERPGNRHMKRSRTLIRSGFYLVAGCI